ncbi:hypothetical protein PHYBLDRAFT_146268 [Phycomyces blakesleeanus NRRL 1555(-)]|uniref:Uncharacterized protein n=1 Tax=Phycomyces blakesleeanus (strain ATCC 8743b / DSM 1359 / FGSC 10004 / NBRC 33097 / NRRL 1555) TaxID=763407 RepID=A0A162U2I8_PHYB8|nr:hypothetical protein PHYBLDRAFT_146268 [Phycomyces blakesleeanus NRRL 1555(-)]OAD72952.1 hypothetical protein PHYBLDRAFT_146268 [Phycomyces blakesleeanus NRRL 1555(-)]|eukprot:XP_018290992.1 hypothetical protein PHYBLDRAFT_146268 [Phycomyces blakesleeanus NRRL 1555(-)]
MLENAINHKILSHTNTNLSLKAPTGTRLNYSIPAKRSPVVWWNQNVVSHQETLSPEIYAAYFEAVPPGCPALILSFKMSITFNQPIINSDVHITTQCPKLLDLSISSVEVKRLKKKYFLSGSQRRSNITEALKRFRKQSIAKVHKNNDISSLKIISLSHIFPINKFDVGKCVNKYFDNKTRKALNSAVVYCKDKADEEEKMAMMRAIKVTVKEKKQSRASIADNSEATFIGKYLMPVIRTVLLKKSGKNIHYAI